MKLKLSLKLKLFVFVFVTFIVIYSFSMTILVNAVNSSIMQQSKKYALLHSAEKAELIKSVFNKSFIKISFLAEIFEDFENYPQESRRTYFMALMKNMLQRDIDLLSVWTIWEPFTIDSLDSKYVGIAGGTYIGSFVATYYHSGGKINLEDDTQPMELFQSNYYTVPKTKMKDVIMLPYYYSYNKKDSILQTSFIIPLLKNNVFCGVAGMDIPLTFIQELIDTVSILNNGQCYLIANNGEIVAHSNSNFAGENILQKNSVLPSNNHVIEQLNQNKIFSFINDSQTGIKEYTTVVPIVFGNSDTPWGLVTTIPLDSLISPAKKLTLLIVFLGGLSVFLLFLLISVLSKKLILPLQSIIEELKKLNRCDIAHLKEIESDNYDEIGELAKSSYQLINWLNNSGQFAKKIGEGNYDTDYTILSKDDILGSSLLEMRDKLKQAREEELRRRDDDKNRTWVTEGVAKFADILRQNNDNIEEYSYSIISNLVRYVKANQGGLFLINDENPENKYIELKAAYAFDQRKYRQKEIKYGATLIGRCILENELIHMTDIPQDYISITSGLGEETPRSLLILPLTFNDQTFGVIELASFTRFEDYKIEFIERLAESIASTISNVKINLRTSELLTQSQRQSEELAMQEEEMRQNLEEISATLEEAGRREKELLSHLQTVGSAFATVEFDSKGKILEANDVFLNLMGYDKREIIGKHQKIFLEEHYYNSTGYGQVWKTLKSGIMQVGDFKYITKQGNKVVLNSGFTPIFSSKGELLKIVQYANDITKISNQIISFESQILGIEKTIIVFECSPKGELLHINKLFTKFLGYRPEEISDKNIDQIIDFEFKQSQEFSVLWKKVARGKVASNNIIFITKDDTEILMHTTFAPIINVNGHIQKIITFAYPIENDMIKNILAFQAMKND